jgi:hypothetical protein
LKLKLIWLNGSDTSFPARILIGIRFGSSGYNCRHIILSELAGFELGTNISAVNYDKENYIDTAENPGKLLDPTKIYRPHA